MACIKITNTNNAESELFNTIYNNIVGQNEEQATILYNWFNSESGKREFGDYQEMYNNLEVSNRVDNNGEPKLFYNETAKKYYFLNKNNEKTYYPLIDRGLRSLFTFNEINLMSSRLAVNYFNTNLNIDFNNIDFSEKVELPNLKQFIVNEITKRVEELEEEGDYLFSVRLEDSLKYIDDIEKNVLNAFKRINIELTENENEDTVLDDVFEDTKDPVYNSHTASRNTKSSVSTDIKLLLSSLEDETILDPVWNKPVLMNKEKVMSSLYSILSDVIPQEGEDLFQTFLSNIDRTRNKKGKSYLNVLYKKLLEADDNLKRRFTQAFYLAKHNHLVDKLVNKGDGKVTHETMQISDTGSKTTKIKEDWNTNFREKFLEKSGKIKVSAVNNLKTKGKESFRSVFEAYDTQKNKNPEFVSKNIEQIIDTVGNNLIEFLNKLGITVTKEGFDNYLDDGGNLTTSKEHLDKLLTLRSQIENYVLKSIENDYNSDSKNPKSILSSSDELNKLAKAQSFFLEEMSDATIITGNSQKWIYSYPSYLKTQIARWKNNPELLWNLYNNDPMLKSSSFIEHIFELRKYPDPNITKEKRLEYAKKNLKNFDLGILNQLTYEENNGLDLTSTFKETTELSKKDYLINDINSVLRKDGYTRTITQADKTTEFRIKYGFRIDSFNGFKKIIDNQGKEDFNISLTYKTKDTFFNYFKNEIERGLKASKEVDAAKMSKSKNLVSHYHFKYGTKDIYDKSGNAFKNNIFQNLNKGQTVTELEKQIVDLIYNEKGEFNFETLSNDKIIELRELFDKYFEQEITKDVKKYLSQLELQGIIVKNNDNKYENSKIDQNIFNSKYNNLTESQKVIALVTDYVTNSLVQNIEYTKLFTGDVAYYKGAVDFKKRVPATYTDGLQLILKPDDKLTFNIATIDAVEINSPLLGLLTPKQLEELDPNVKNTLTKINSTDAQAWITPERWKFLVTALGKWTPLHDKVYAKMQSETPVEWSEKELKLAAQPLKGVYFYKDNYGQPVYLKYSQAVLTKSLVKGSGLRKMLDKMNSNNVDELITFDGVKVGAITPTTIHNEDGSIKDDFELNVQTLNNYGWKLQQDLPTKTFKATDVGSQLQKNIFAGILPNLEDENFFYKGEFRNGQYILNEIVKTVTGLSNKGFNKLSKKLDVDENGVIKDVSKLYTLIINELKQRGGSENVIKALEAEVSIVGVPQSAGKLYQIFASVANKSIIKIKTNGGSLIQMSEFGLSFKTKEDRANSGIKLNPNLDYDTTMAPVAYTDEETGRKKVKPGSIFVPASLIAKYIPDWNNYSAEELFVGVNGKSPIIDKNIQENIIGYRIPNQGLASNDALQIAGILPEGQGDTVVAYTGITKKTGSDFDIDKMFVMMPTFKPVYTKSDEIYKYVNKTLEGSNKAETVANYLNFLNQFNNSDSEVDIEAIKDYFDAQKTVEAKYALINQTKQEVLDILFDKNNKNIPIVKKVFETFDIKVKYLKYADVLENDLIELYKSVLTNPTVYNSVMTSVDNDMIKDEIKDIRKTSNISFMAVVDKLEDIDLRYSFLGGKAGVGMEANAMVDIYRPGEIYLQNVPKIKWGNREENDLRLDLEYSEELSEEDLNYYVDTFLKKDVSKEQKEEFKNSIRKVKIGTTLTSILNAFVDIAKDAYISDGNWNTSTTNAGNLLIRAGVHPLYVVNFLANDIITQYTNFQKNNEGLTDNDSGDTFEKFKSYYVKKKLLDLNPLYGSLYENNYKDLNIDYQIKKLEEAGATEKVNSLLKKKANVEIRLRKLLKDNYDDFITNADKYHQEVFRPDNLDVYDRNTLQYGKHKLNLQYFRESNKNNKENLTFQFNLLKAFKDLQEYSKNVKEIVDFGKLDTNGFGKDHNNLFTLYNLLQSIREKEASGDSGTIKGFESKLNNTTLNAYFQNLIKLGKIVEANPNIFPTSKYNVRNLFNVISNDIYGKDLVNEELTTKLSKHFNTYLMNNVFNLINEERNELINNVPKEILRARETNPELFILNELTIVSPRNETEISTITLNNKQKSAEYEQMFIDSWRDLKIENPELADRLVQYSFVTSGFQMSQGQFFTFIPFEYNVDVLNINNKLLNIFNKDNFDDFIDKFYINNRGDNAVVKTLNPKEIRELPESTVEIIDPSGNKINKTISNALTFDFKNKTPYRFIQYSGNVYKNLGKIKNGSSLFVKIKTPTTKFINYNEVVEYDTKKLNEYQNMIVENISTESEVVNRPEMNNTIETKQEVKSEVNNMNELTNHSGGAKGGDMVWDSVGKEYGVTNHNHYTTKYFDNLSPEEQVELSQQYLQTAKWLGRGVINSESYAGKLVRRDMIQANNSDGIFGVTELVKPGVNGRKGYTNKTNHSIPEGGTGYAVTRGILTNKPTFVFNQSDNYGNEIGWYKWNVKLNDFIKVDTPILTKNYTGIGSQEINELGVQAIRDVYEKTKNSLSEIKNINKPQQLSLFDNLQESKTMLNLKQMFDNDLMLNKFNELGINNVDDLNKLSEDELGELLKKICK